ncbi:phosphotransferase-like protein [Planococcus lenghuensis]|uniref:phosphotransferase-like protein n=1 Tax=Planococcus lenghuensis TaxID=2213202 RepID=UPI0012EB313F
MSYCPAEELIRREEARGDRRAGLALTQLAFIYQQQELYHIAVDTFYSVCPTNR